MTSTAWARVADDVCRRIASGETPIGAKIASQQQLVTRLGVSPGTVKRAIDHLKEVGILEGQQGAGNFVRRLPTDDDMDTERRTLEARVAELERQLAAGEGRIDRLESELRELQSRVGVQPGRRTARKRTG